MGGIIINTQEKTFITNFSFNFLSFYKLNYLVSVVLGKFFHIQNLTNYQTQRNSCEALNERCYCMTLHIWFSKKHVALK